VYYGDVLEDNDQERRKLENASQRAAEAWRFRHLETRAIDVLRDRVANVCGFLSECLDRLEVAMRPTRERTSY